VTVACGFGMFRCPNNGRCISEQLICNGRDDCGDQSDERNCSKLHFVLTLLTLHKHQMEARKKHEHKKQFVQCSIY